jgi:hypothetical protein
LARIAIVVLAFALFSAPAASANGVAGVVRETGSATEAVTKTLPDLPLPVETPDVPEVSVPAPPPTVTKPPPASVPSAPSATPAVEVAPSGLGGEAGTPAGAEGQAPGTLPSPDSGATSAPAARQPDRRSIDPAEVAPRGRWRAYIWPALALRVRAALAPLLTRLNDFVDDVPAPEAVGLFSSPTVSDSVGIDRHSESQAQPSRDPRSSSVAFIPEEEMGFLASLLIVLLTVVGLVALARLVVGEALFEAQHWRGHRG